MVAGATVLITGGASGIGLATARRFAADGAEVVVSDLDVAAGEVAAGEVGGRFVQLDVTDPEAWTRALDEVGALDVAHLNAGLAIGQPDPVALTDDDYRRIMAVNVDGIVFGVRAVARALQERGGGAIVVTASLGGLTPMPTDPVYSLTKHGVVAYVRSVAPLLAERGITINAVCPGFTETPLLTAAERDRLDAADLTLIAPEVVAGAVAQILDEGRTGEAWYCQVGRPPAPFEFRRVPGPRTGDPRREDP